MEQPRQSRGEPAGIEVERREVVLEVDVEPLAACVLRMSGGDADELDADASPLVARPHFRVEQERVVATVPGDVREPDEPSVFRSCGDPAQAVRPDAVPPSRFATTSVRLGELGELFVSEIAAPLESDAELR